MSKPKIIEDIETLQSNLNLVQSGGLAGAFESMPFVGTSPMVESGSNANGNYIKFADGTMICCVFVTGVYDIATPVAGGYRTSGITWETPATFIDTNFIVIGTPIGGEVFSIRAGATSTSTGAYSYTRVTSALNVPCSGNLFAIGRWKA